MLKIFALLIFLLMSTTLLIFGYNLLIKTEFMIQQHIKIFGIHKDSFSYRYMTNEKNIWHYKFSASIAILMGLLLLVFFFIKLRE